MAKDQWMRENDIVDFDEFLASKQIAPDDERVLLLKEFWNQGVVSACNYFGYQEGTAHGAEEAVKAN